ncbi:hypothetical protein HZS_6743 [Henneguya salminicola]|nr:hypothetical protein HZS_6743 [Henneguya salminicola]
MSLKNDTLLLSQFDLKFILNLNEAAQCNDERRLLLIILNIPDYLNKNSYPNIVTTIFSRLANVFVDGSTLLKVYISRSIVKCQNHVHMITSLGDIISKFSQVFYSSDPIGRSAALIIFTTLACNLRKAQIPSLSNELENNEEKFKTNSLFYQILISLQSKDNSELESAIIASHKFAKYSSQYSEFLLQKLPTIIDNCFDDEILQKLILSYSYMFHSAIMADTALIQCKSYFERVPNSIFISTTKLVRKCPWMIKDHVKYCIEQLILVENKKITATILKQLRKISIMLPEVFDHSHINTIFLNYSKVDLSNLLLDYFCNIFSDFITHCSKPDIIDSKISQFIVKNICFKTNIPIGANTISNWLLILHIDRSSPMGPEDLQFLKIMTINCYRNKNTQPHIYRYIAFIVTYQYIYQENPDYSWLFEYISIINHSDLYSIAIVCTLRGVYDVSTKLFCHLTEHPQIRPTPLGEIILFQSLCNLELTAKLFPNQIDISHAYKKNHQSHFRSTYYTARKRSLEVGYTLMSLFQNISLEALNDTNNYFSFFIEKYLNEIQDIEQTWSTLYKYLYDSDPFSKNLIQNYTDIFKNLTHLLMYKDMNIDILDHSRYIHPFTKKTSALLKSLSSNFSLKDTFLCYIQNTICVPWPLPMYFYRSKYFVKTGIYFKVNSDSFHTSNEEKQCKLDEIFNFSIQGYFTLHDHSSINSFAAHSHTIRSVQLLTSYLKVEPKSINSKTYSILNYQDLKDGHFNAHFGLTFEEEGTYLLDVSVNGLVDENNDIWYYHDISCSQLCSYTVTYTFNYTLIMSLI